MGACTFDQIIVGKFETVRDAYNAAVEQTQYDYGHDPYNGTISTCNYPSIDTDAPRYGTKAFQKYLDKKLDKMEKYDCLAVEIKGQLFKKLKERHGYKGKKGVKAYFFYGWAGC